MDTQYIKRDDNPKSFLNPLKFDVTDDIRGDDNKIVTYIIPSMEISTYPTWLADRIIEDIIVAIVNERRLGNITPEEREKIRKEIIIG